MTPEQLHVFYGHAVKALEPIATALRCPVSDLVLMGFHLAPSEDDDREPGEWVLQIHYSTRTGSAVGEVLEHGVSMLTLTLGTDDPIRALTRLCRGNAKGGR